MKRACKQISFALCFFLLLVIFIPFHAESVKAFETYLYPKTLTSDGKKLYIGTDNGLLTWDGKKLSSVKPPYLPSAKITAVNAHDGNYFIVGTDGGAAYPYHQDYWRVVTKSDGIPATSVTAAANCKTQILIGTSNGLAVFQKNTTSKPVIYKYPEIPHNFITTISCAQDQVFVGTMSGVVKISGQYAYNISPVSANKMQIANGKLWIASSQGLLELDMQGRLIKRWDVNSGLYSSNISTLTVDTKNNVVYIYDGKNIVRMSDMKKYPLGSTINDMAYMNGIFYLATPNGLFSTYDFMDFINIYSSAPYEQAAFTSGSHMISVRDGILFIDGKPASVSGVVRAYPGDLITVVTSNQVLLVDPTRLTRYTVKSDVFLEVAPYSIQNAYYSSSSGMLYLAGYGQLYAIHRASGSYKKVPLPFYSVKSLWSDGKYVYALSERASFIGDTWGKLIRTNTLNFYVKSAVLSSSSLLFVATDDGIKYASSLWSSFKDYSGVNANKIFLPINSSNVWVSTETNLIKLNNPSIYYNWGNGLSFIPDQLFYDGSGLKFFSLGSIQSAWKPSFMADWLTITGKEEASKLQAAGILRGFSDKMYPQKTLTYQELAVMYVRLKGWSLTKATTSAKADEWAKPYIASLEQRGYKLNVDYRSVATKAVVNDWLPDIGPLFTYNTITRQQAAMQLYNYMAY
ncbi:S-layer homology domain-containing protein [Coprothermobacter platensis]|uniref:S-layer homology domain-containing protein n=1 Tax=Coprothermobacter platensis TaxID=108819 RepID=UPI00035D84DC|nr:S-layer homology domain-containing protein [Coprothermobacter platensis]